VPGDGVGPYVVNSVVKIASYIAPELEFEEYLISQKTWKERGESIYKDIENLVDRNRNIFKGPINTKGMSKSAVVYMRDVAQVNAIIRPIKSLPWSKESYNFIIFRQGREGLYSGKERREINDDEIVITERVFSRKQLGSFFSKAFEYAERNKLGVICASKPTVIKMGDGFWNEIFDEVGKNYPLVPKEKINVDDCFHKIAQNPATLNGKVIVLENSQGDLASSISPVPPWSLGSAAIGEKANIFEPVHGTADDLIERGQRERINPTGAIRALSLMLYSFGWDEKGRKLEEITDEVLKESYENGKIDGNMNFIGMSTDEFTNRIIEKLQTT